MSGEHGQESVSGCIGELICQAYCGQYLLYHFDNTFGISSGDIGNMIAESLEFDGHRDLPQLSNRPGADISRSIALARHMHYRFRVPYVLQMLSRSSSFTLIIFELLQYTAVEKNNEMH